MRATLPEVRTFGPDSTPAELREELARLNRKAMRCPDHYTDRRAGIHAAMNQILTWLGY